MELILTLLLAGPLGFLSRTPKRGLTLYLLAWAIVFPVQTAVVFSEGDGDPSYWLVNAVILGAGIGLNRLGWTMGERRRMREVTEETGAALKAIAAAGLVAGALALAPSPASAHGGLPDAEIFATNNTAVITDPGDPRLDKRLNGFARKVTRMIREGGGIPRGSQLLDGVFFSSDFNLTTFERSRDFDVDHVTVRELSQIAERVRRRFDQQSVLTFDYLPAHAERVDGIELEVPGVSADALRQGLLDDRAALEALFGGSVTQDGRLLLVADLANAELARAFAASIGGDMGRATTHTGDLEFVG